MAGGWAGLHEDRFEAGVRGAFQIAVVIANQPGVCTVDAEHLASLIDEAGCRLAAIAGKFEFRALACETFVWMVGTIKDGVEEGSVFGQQVF